MRQLRLAAVAVVATLALAGCGDDEPDPGEANSTWTPSGTIEEPSSSAPPAKPTEPPLPDAATKATKAGARAFITYYWDLVNYAQLTGDVKALKAVSGETCEGCQNGIVGITDLYAGGSRTTGGRNTIVVTHVKEVSDKAKSLYGMEIVLKATNEQQTIIKADGTKEVSDTGTTEFVSYLIWVDDAWRVDILDPK